MGVYYPNTCNPVTGHNCDPCEEQELGRIRSSAFIANDFVFVDETDPAEWAAGIAAGSIFIIPETHGEVPEPSEKLGPGFGDTTETLIAFDQSAHYYDPNFASNCEFYESIKRNRNFKYAFRTSSKTYITDKPVVIIPKYGVQDDLTTLVNWNIMVKWQSINLPCPFNTPEGIFDTCYDPN